MNLVQNNVCVCVCAYMHACAEREAHTYMSNGFGIVWGRVSIEARYWEEQ